MPRLLSALLILMALAGCADGDDDYRDEFPPRDRELAQLGDDVEGALRGAAQSDDASLAARFDGFARRLGRVRDRLEDLDPPPELERDHERLLAASAEARDALARTAAATGRGDAVAARDAATALVRGGSRLDQARAAVRRGL